MSIKPLRIALAFQFLTILPVPYGRPDSIDEKDIGGSSAYFPLVGLVQGMLVSLLYVLVVNIFPLDVTAGLLIALLTVSNGGFHLDGLSDTFDALASRKNRERRLEIMKDSTTGPIGVVSIVLVLLLKYLSLKNILAASESWAFTALILFPVVGRWAMVPALYHGMSARQDGLGKVFLENTGKPELLIASASAFIIALLAVLSGSHRAFNPFLVVKIVVLLSLVYALSFGLVKYFERAFGGMTGDNLGATSEITEVLWLLVFLIYFR